MDSQMTVGKKLTLIGAMLIGFTIVLGVVTLIGLRSYDKIVTSLADDALAGVSACSKVESDFLELRGDAWRHVAASDPKDKENQDREIQRLRGEIASAMKRFRLPFLPMRSARSIRRSTLRCDASTIPGKKLRP